MKTITSKTACLNKARELREIPSAVRSGLYKSYLHMYNLLPSSERDGFSLPIAELIANDHNSLSFAFSAADLLVEIDCAEVVNPDSKYGFDGYHFSDDSYLGRDGKVYLSAADMERAL